MHMRDFSIVMDADSLSANRSTSGAEQTLLPDHILRTNYSTSATSLFEDHGRSVNAKARRQHTLRSIGRRASRCRSPLVVGNGGVQLEDLTPQNGSSRDRVIKSLDNNLLASLNNYEGDRQTTNRISAPVCSQLSPAGQFSLGAVLDNGRQSRSISQVERNNQGYDSNGNKNARDTINVSAFSTTTLSMNSSLESSASGEENITGSEENSQPSNQGDNVINISTTGEHESLTGFEIVWLNFTYMVEPNIFEDPRWGRVNRLFHKEKRTILKGLSGGVRSGQMVALMGPSGAGKTCLLECLSGVRRTGIGGKVLLRGREKAQLVIVPQHDDFMSQFTVEEIITYGSKIKNPPSSDHKAIADEMIKQFGLEICRHNNIQRCSGGQRKRVAIAQELVSKPNILILDEPTSGLDSSCCFQTMRVLREVLDKSVRTSEPMVIITTIHQPSAKVFKMFDSVYLLSKTGYAAYSGPPSHLLSTIRNLTGLQCPKYSNPSDYMIELVSYDYGEEPLEELVEFEKKKARQFVRDFEFRAKMKANELLIDRERVGTIDEPPEGNFRGSKSETQLVGKIELLERNRVGVSHGINYKRNVSVPLRRATSSSNLRHPLFWHIFVHIHRSFFQSIRDPVLNNMRVLIHIIFALLLVTLFGRKSGEARGCPPILGLPTEITDPDSENIIDLADNIGYLFMCIMMITYVSLMTTVLTFPIDIKTVGKEFKNGWYGTLTYFLGKTIADLPFIFVYPIVYCAIVWNLTNQGSGQPWRFARFTALIIINAMNSQSFGLILGALFMNSVAAATFLGPVMTIPWYLFTGFTKRVHRLDGIFKVASKFLFTRYIFEGLLDTVYGHQRCNCSSFLDKYNHLRHEEAVRLGQLISLETLSSLDYYDGIDLIAPPNASSTGSGWIEKTVDAATSVFADGEDLDLISLMNTNVKASSMFSFGLDFEPTCPANYQNFIIQDFRLEDDTSEKAFLFTFVMFIMTRVLTFIVVSWKIRTREM